MPGPQTATISSYSASEACSNVPYSSVAAPTCSISSRRGPAVLSLAPPRPRGCSAPGTPSAAKRRTRATSAPGGGIDATSAAARRAASVCGASSLVSARRARSVCAGAGAAASLCRLGVRSVLGAAFFRLRQRYASLRRERGALTGARAALAAQALQLEEARRVLEDSEHHKNAEAAQDRVGFVSERRAYEARVMQLQVGTMQRHRCCGHHHCLLRHHHCPAVASLPSTTQRFAEEVLHVQPSTICCQHLSKPNDEMSNQISHDGCAPSP